MSVMISFSLFFSKKEYDVVKYAAFSARGGKTSYSVGYGILGVFILVNYSDEVKYLFFIFLECL